MSGHDDTIGIELADTQAVDAFGVQVVVDGHDVLATVRADAPGILRALDFPLVPDCVARAGWTIGFLQRGPLRLPVNMPCDGWVVAAISDGARVEHGTALFRILRASQEISA